MADELGRLFEGVEKLRKIAFDRNEDPTVRVQNAFKAVEFAIAACAIKFGKNRPERGKELLFIELNFGAKARDEFKAVMTAYYDSYGIVSAQRAEYVRSKTKALLTTIYATIGERFELE